MPFSFIQQLGDLDDPRLCLFDTVPKGVEGQAYCFGLGKPVQNYPRDAKLYMTRENPGIKLSDFIGNTRGMLVASSAFRRLIEKHCAGADIQYLPITIIDHKKRPYSKDYCIVNPVGTYDCADLKASDLERVSNGEVAHVNKLVLSRKKAEKVPQLFRFDLYPQLYIFGPALTDDILTNKLSNVVLYEVEVAPQ